MSRAAPEIRPLSAADLPHVVVLERRAFPTPWSEAMFALELGRPGGVHLGAWDRQEDRLVGHLICSRLDLVWHLMNVAVDPLHRREGIASALLGELLGRLPRAGAEVTLEVRASNRGAISLYERFGFMAAGRRTRYYADTGEDAVLMWRTAATLAGSLEGIPGVRTPGIRGDS